MTQDSYSAHKATLEMALAAIRARTFWSAYSDRPIPSVYGEDALAHAAPRFKARLNQPFPIDQPNEAGEWVGAERSPYGFPLGILYPKSEPEELIAGARKAMSAWPSAHPEERAETLIEAITRINRESADLAHALMHTTGQSLTMAFRAGGPNAQDRALEAVAYAYDAMMAVPQQPVLWERPQGGNPPVRLRKHFHVVPRGIALIIGCSTFPTWNAYPGIFASLATGNAVIVKPHPNAILPLAISVAVLRETLRDAGFDPNLITLAADTPDAPVTKRLALDPHVRLIDFAGSPEFGGWLEDNARQAQVYTEKAGINAVVVDDFDDIEGMAENLAFSFSLYSGQMGTTPQNIFIPEAGIAAGGRGLSFEEVASRIAAAVEALLVEPAEAVEILGAIRTEVTLRRIEEARQCGEVVLQSHTIQHPQYPGAEIRTPLIVKLKGGDDPAYLREFFGPVVFLIPTRDTADSLARMEASITDHGGLAVGLYSQDRDVIEQCEAAALRAGVNLSVNLVGNIYLNQSTAFSDYHGSGANAASNAVLIDHAFVADRFRVVQSRFLAPPRAAE